MSPKNARPAALRSGNLPEVAVRIAEVPEVTTQPRGPGFLHNFAASPLCVAHDFIETLGGSSLRAARPTSWMLTSSSAPAAPSSRSSPPTPTTSGCWTQRSTSPLCDTRETIARPVGAVAGTLMAAWYRRSLIQTNQLSALAQVQSALW